MPWSANEARDQLIRAVLIHLEIHGEQETIAQLRDELGRLTMLHEIKRNNAEIVRLTQRITELDECLITAVDALGFYADEDNYADRPGKLSAVRKDKGSTARDALEAINAAAKEAPEEDRNGKP